MYNLKKFIDYLDLKNIARKNDNLFMGIGNDDRSDVFVITQNIPTGKPSTAFRNKIEYDKDTIFITYTGTRKYNDSAKKMNDLYQHILNNIEELKKIGIIQAIPEKPIMIEMKKQFHTSAMIIDIIYEREKIWQ